MRLSHSGSCYNGLLGTAQTLLVHCWLISSPLKWVQFSQLYFGSYSHQTCFCMVAAIPIKHVSVLWQLFPSNMFLYCGSYSHQTCFCIVAAIPIKHVSVLWQLFPSNMCLYCGSYLNNMQVFHVHCTRSSFLLPLLYWEQCSLFYALCVDWFINGEDMTVCI